MTEQGPGIVPGSAVDDDHDAGISDRAERSDRAARLQQVAIAIGMFLLAVLLPLVDHIELWPITAVGGVISGLLLWGALRDESIAGPVVGLVLTATIGMFVGDDPAVGSLASVIVAIVLGEHLATAQHSRYATPGHAASLLGIGSAALHGIVAVTAATLTMVATLLPQARVWSIAAIVALGIVAVTVQRRRAAIAAQPLPPPEPVA